MVVIVVVMIEVVTVDTVVAVVVNGVVLIMASIDVAAVAGAALREGVEGRSRARKARAA